MKERDQLEEPDISGSILLKWVGREWTRLMWVGANGRLL